MRVTNTYFITGAIAVFALVALGALTWLTFALSDERTELAALRDEQAQLAARQAQARSMRTLARDTQAQRATLAALTTDRDVVDIIDRLENMGSETGVAVTVDAVSAGEVTDTFQAIVISLRVVGEFDAIFHYLTLLETLPAAATLEQMIMEESGGEDGQWRVSIRERVFIEEQ